METRIEKDKRNVMTKKADIISRISIARVYVNQKNKDGVRILVDALWPRGIKKETLKADMWLKEIAPSNELRRWFSHDPDKWDEFKRRYSAELDKKQDLCNLIIETARNSNVILLYGARDTKHNNAAALKSYLESRLLSR